MSQPKPRPLLVSFLALLFLLEAIAALGLAAFLLLSPSGATFASSLFNRLQWSAGLGSLMAVPPLLTAGLAGMVFRGLWRQREWARLAALAISLLVVLSAVMGLAFVAAFGLGNTINWAAGLIFLILSGVIFLYLLRARFGPDEAPEANVSAPAGISAQAPISATPAQTPYVVSSPTPLPPRPASIPGASGQLIPPPPRPSVSTQPTPTTLAGHDAATLAAQTGVGASTQQIPAPARPAAARAPAAWLLVRNGAQRGQEFALYPGETLMLGRDPDRAQAVLTDPTVSGLHAQVLYEQDRFVIYDLGSTNGAFLGDQRIQRQPLLDDDELRLGSTWLLFTTKHP